MAVLKGRNICRKMIPEGVILLEHDGTLPFSAEDRVAIFGRAQAEYIKSGSGSAGRVQCPYILNFKDELKKRVCIDETVSAYFEHYIQNNPYDRANDWNFPASQKQPFLEESFVRGAAERNDKAVFVIGRICGESYDCELQKGNWFLSDEEEQSISLIRRYFKKFAVIVNTGNLIDFQWIKKYNIGTVVLAWQGGQDGAGGTVDALMGDIPPSGRLTDTIADDIAAFPFLEEFGNETQNIHKEDIYVGYRYFETFARERVLYPFGYGLNYTEFRQIVKRASKRGNTIRLCVDVENIGAYDGKDVVQVYCSAPQGVLGKPARVLVGYKKTRLLHPGERESVCFSLNIADMASYDDNGKSGFIYSYVLEKGRYGLFVGENVRAAQLAFSFELAETICVNVLSQAMAPCVSFQRLTTKDGKTPCFEDVPLRGYDLAERILENLPSAKKITGECGYSFTDAVEGKVAMEDFVAQFDAKTLCMLLRGEGMSSPKASVPGSASCIGGVTSAWRKADVPIVTTCDGPSGLRMECGAQATCIPCGTMLASTWNETCVKTVFSVVAEEMKKYGVDLLLAPALNIHRNPLCGRNFEYFSEDPLLAGSFASAVAEALYKNDVFGTVKHFAANCQEKARGRENEVMSERCAREIYLKGFEIAVRNGFVRSVMTSYNRINGISSSSNYDLNTVLLRNEWGFDGFVMTDWWACADDLQSGTFRKQNVAAMVKAQNDVFMVVADAERADDDLEAAFASGYLTLGELQRSAINVLRFIAGTRAYKERAGLAVETEEYSELVWQTRMSNEKVPAVVGYHDYLGITVQVRLMREGMYQMEVEYSAAEDELVQITERVAVDQVFSVTQVLGGTCGKTEISRFSVYLRKNSELFFDGNVKYGVIRIYQKKENGHGNQG